MSIDDELPSIDSTIEGVDGGREPDGECMSHESRLLSFDSTKEEGTVYADAERVHERGGGEGEEGADAVLVVQVEVEVVAVAGQNIFAFRG